MCHIPLCLHAILLLYYYYVLYYGSDLYCMFPRTTTVVSGHQDVLDHIENTSHLQDPEFVETPICKPRVMLRSRLRRTWYGFYMTL